MINVITGQKHCGIIRIKHVILLILDWNLKKKLIIFLRAIGFKKLNRCLNIKRKIGNDYTSQTVFIILLLYLKKK